MMESDLTALDAARMCKALGHPARIGILRQLLREERCICGRIVEVLPLAQSTVSQHLKVLKDAGLISGEVEGPRTCYCADRQRLAALAAALSRCFPPVGKNSDETRTPTRYESAALSHPAHGLPPGAAGRSR